MITDLKQAKAKAISENPFYGLKNMLTMQRFFEKIEDKSTNKGEVQRVVANAWAETNGDRTLKQMFFVILFNAGDIANREHNMFGKIKVLQGGQAKRNAFRHAMEWVLREQEAQFYEFLPLIAEYTNYENLFYNQLRTDRRKGTVLSKDRLNVDYDRVATFLAAKLNDVGTTDFERELIAKFLPKVPAAKRWRKDKDGKTVARSKKSDTLNKDRYTFQLIAAVSKAMGMEEIVHERNVQYKGYMKFRSENLKNSEAHLFSTKKVTQFDRTQFLTWLEGLPAGARYRVQCRIVDKEGTTLKANDKWKNAQGEVLGSIYIQWLKEKEEAMKKLVALTAEERKDMNKDELKALTKQARITTGGNTIYDVFVDLYKEGRGSFNVGSEVNVKLQTLIDKVKIDVPVLTIIDRSGSMGGSVRLGSDGPMVDRLEFCRLIAAIMLYKNPNVDLASMFMVFGSTAEVFYDGGAVTSNTGINRYVQGATRSTQVQKLADRQKPFIETFNTMRSLIELRGGTELNCVARDLKAWVDQDPALKQQRIEAIQEFPVWLILSDGDLNSHYSPASSMQAFKNDMLQYFGANPVVVLWDITTQEHNSTKFENIENMIHISGMNPAVLNQVFMNINDLDVIDIYTTLKSLFESNRYEPVKELTL